MSRWWRAYDEAVDDPKLQRISDKLFRGWFNVCCITSQNGGGLPSFEDIAFKLRCSPAKAEALVRELVAAGLVDETEGKFAPHNWDGRQFKSDTSTERVKRFRKRERNVSETKNGNAPDTEQNRTDSREGASEFEEWYRTYPKREARGAAEKAYRTARKSAEAAVLLAGAEKAKQKYAGAEPKFIPLPATWLNQKRWLDEAAPPVSGRRSDAAERLYREGIV